MSIEDLSVRIEHTSWKDGITLTFHFMKDGKEVNVFDNLNKKYDAFNLTPAIFQKGKTPTPWKNLASSLMASITDQDKQDSEVITFNKNITASMSVNFGKENTEYINKIDILIKQAVTKLLNTLSKSTVDTIFNGGVNSASDEEDYQLMKSMGYTDDEICFIVKYIMVLKEKKSTFSNSYNSFSFGKDVMFHTIYAGKGTTFQIKSKVYRGDTPGVYDWKVAGIDGNALTGRKYMAEFNKFDKPFLYLTINPEHKANPSKLYVKATDVTVTMHE